MLKTKILFLMGVIFLVNLSFGNEQYFMGQRTPGERAVRFLPDILFNTDNKKMSTELHSSVYFSGDKRSIYFVVQTKIHEEKSLKKTIMRAKFNGQIWSQPEPMDFTKEKSEGMLSASFDGKTLYFCPLGKDIKRIVYSVRKENEAWTAPIRFVSPINESPFGMLPSFSRKGNMYYSVNLGKGKGLGQIMFSEFKDGVYKPATLLPEVINSPGFEVGCTIAPDESFIIFFSMGHHSEYPGQYISFRDSGGVWRPAVRLGPEINDGGVAFATSLSPDGKYLFFLIRQNKFMKIRGEPREPGMYWISTEAFKN